MPETIPQISALIQPIPPPPRPELLRTREPWCAGADVTRRSKPHRLVDRAVARSATPEFDPYPLSDLLRTRLPAGAGLARPVRLCVRIRARVASQTRRGTAALEEGHGLASQPTLSRLLDTLSREENLPVLHQAVTELACRRIEMIEGRRRKRGKKTPRKKRRKKTMYLDVDGLPVEVHGHPPGSEWNGYYRQRMYHGLVASCAETGESGSQALKLTLRVVDRCRGRAVRLDDRADGCGVPGAAAAGAGVEKRALYHPPGTLNRRGDPRMHRRGSGSMS